MLGCGSRRRRAAVILIAIVAAILPEIVFLVDESSCSSIKFTSPLNAITNPYVPGCLLWLFQFLLCSSIWGKYFHLYITIKLEETRNNEKSSPWGVFHRERSTLTAGCQSLLSLQLEGKKLTTVFPYVSKESWVWFSWIALFFLLVLLRSVLIEKKKRSFNFFFSFFSFFKFVGGYTSQCVF